jgi:hypothetical protein
LYADTLLCGRLIGRTKRGLNSNLHALTKELGRPILLFLTAANVSDYIDAQEPLSSTPDMINEARLAELQPLVTSG